MRIFPLARLCVPQDAAVQGCPMCSGQHFGGKLDYGSVRDYRAFPDDNDSVGTVEKPVVSVFIRFSVYIDAAVVADMRVLVDNRLIYLAVLSDSKVWNFFPCIFSLFF